MSLSGAVRRGSARLLAVLVLAASLTAPGVWHPPTALAAPSVAFTDVPDGAVVGSRYTFGGTVAEATAVEVSTDGGSRWQQVGVLEGRWNHTYTPTSSGTAELRVRALDPTGDVIAKDAAGPAVAARVCPCGLWNDEDRPRVADLADSTALELGVKWRAASDGYVRGVRFYKGPGNTGTHTGSLWTSTGVLLATGTFRDETATGWQTLIFAKPVAIAGNTTHVVSYLSPTGHFSADTGYFTASARHLEPLTGLQSGADGLNGVFRTNGAGFPNRTARDSNYWVDVIWAPEPGADTRPPALLTADPSAGFDGVALTATVSGTYDEVVDPASAELTVTGPTGPVAGSTSVTGNGVTVRFVPSAPLDPGVTYTAAVRARDASGNQAAAHNWAFTTGSPRPASCPCTVWDDFTHPTEASVSEVSNVELGVKVQFEGRGEVLGVRFFKGQGNTGTHTGSFWSSTGLLLATGTFTNETTMGWQTLRFHSPVSVQANTTYVVSYRAPRGGFAIDRHFFTKEAGYGGIRALASGVDGSNGVYVYGGGFPRFSKNDANYWVDVLYRNGLNGDTTAPSLVARTPVPDAESVPHAGTLSLTYSEALDPASPRVWLTDPGGAVLRGTAKLEDDHRTVTWRPDAPLKPGTRYTATARAADLNGNISGPATWTMTTDPTPACPCSLFSSATVPTIPAAADNGSYELGVRFKVAYNGRVTGVRFYKGVGNTGTHTGSLWSVTGQRLATGTFQGETATGWQTLTFATPVDVRAGTTYVASYTAPNGRYAVDHGYFRSLTVESFPLTAPSDTPDTPNGVYAVGGGFPTTVHQGNNYWVDVDYTFSGDLTRPVAQGHTPLGGALEVERGGQVTATFDEPVDVSATAMTVRDGGGARLDGTLTRTPDGRTVVWTPRGPLTANTRHTATALAVDETGNRADPVTWNFTTTATQTCPCTLFSDAVVPGELFESQATNVGVRFSPTADGHVTAVRFYKGRYDQGSHTGSLWAGDGTLLASGTFTGQTASGWQTLVFDTPVPVAAGGAYVASRTVPGGRSVADPGYFTDHRVDSPPLTTPVGASVVGGEGMPSTVSEAGVNHWVDVVFTTP